MLGLKKRFALFTALILGLWVLGAAPASAQATRTWVSGVGDDVNPCSRTAPCKTFAGAISKTAAGGEINCLDPGGFGAVTINKSMTIACQYTEGGALAGGNGITVNLPAAADVVYIRGLDIFGVNPPTHGVRFIGNGTLHIEDCTIRRFNALNSQGVSFQPTGAGTLFMNNVTVAENGNGTSGGGILIQPTGASGSARAVLTDVRVKNNANAGLRIDTGSATAAAGITVTIDRILITGSGGAGISTNTIAVGVPAKVMLVNSTLANNISHGILAGGPGTTFRVGNTTIHGNGFGVQFGTGAIGNTYGDNRLDGNAPDGTFTTPAIPKD
jgi:hypothetical protein